MELNFVPDSILLFYQAYRQSLDSEFGALQILCDKYGSDKGSLLARSSSHAYKWDAHSYARIYEYLFAPIKNKVKYVFECGIGTSKKDILSSMLSSKYRPGASLYIWRDYFSHTIQTVFGADIDAEVLFEDDQIKTGYLDQFDPVSIKHYFQQISTIRFDIMIDDGYHSAQAAITLFENSINFLQKSGLYCIEDMFDHDLITLYDYFKNKNFKINYFNMSRKENENNNLIVISK